jgi:hypothetical protein
MWGRTDGGPGLRALLREDLATHGGRRASPGFHAVAVHPARA